MSDCSLTEVPWFSVSLHIVKNVPLKRCLSQCWKTESFKKLEAFYVLLLGKNYSKEVLRIFLSRLCGVPQRVWVSNAIIIHKRFFCRTQTRKKEIKWENCSHDINLVT